MKITRCLLLMLVALVTLAGCESLVENVDSFESTSKLVVRSYISPQDTVLAVRLQKTQPALGKQLSEEQRKVKDATVTIANGSSVVALQYNPETNQYEADARAWPIEAGKTYHLKVVSATGNAAATCTVPQTDGIAITDVQAPYTMVEDYYGQEVPRYTLSFKWTDAPQVKNYYRTLAYKIYTYTDPNTGSKRVYKEGIYFDYNDAGNLLTDDDAQNGVIAAVPMVYHDYNFKSRDKPHQIFVVLVVADQHYYDYQRTLNEQTKVNGNPFAEPVVLYTNIQGGLGVFAGYNQLVASIEVE